MNIQLMMVYTVNLVVHEPLRGRLALSMQNRTLACGASGTQQTGIGRSRKRPGVWLPRCAQQLSATPAQHPPLAKARASC